MAYIILRFSEYNGNNIVTLGLYPVNIIKNDIEEGLKVLSEYFNKLNIMVNPEKKQAMFFTRTLNFQNHDVTWKKLVKYPGVNLD